MNCRLTSPRENNIYQKSTEFDLARRALDDKSYSNRITLKNSV